MSRLRVLSLFSGIGGLDLGLERAGMEIISHSEIDPYACKVLEKHWPDVPNLGDITKADWSDWVGLVDVIAGGFPCQDVSRAGRRVGVVDGESSRDYFERLSEPFAIFDHGTCCWKTPQLSLLTDLEKFSGSWPRSGMTLNGSAYRRQPLVPTIFAIGCSLLPTPVADDTGHRKKPYSQGGRALSLVLGGPWSPEFGEWMMGLPLGFTKVESVH